MLNVCINDFLILCQTSWRLLSANIQYTELGNPVVFLLIISIWNCCIKHPTFNLFWEWTFLKMGGGLGLWCGKNRYGPLPGGGKGCWLVYSAFSGKQPAACYRSKGWGFKYVLPTEGEGGYIVSTSRLNYPTAPSPLLLTFLHWPGSRSHFTSGQRSRHEWSRGHHISRVVYCIRERFFLRSATRGPSATDYSLNNAVLVRDR